MNTSANFTVTRNRACLALLCLAGAIIAVLCVSLRGITPLVSVHAHEGPVVAIAISPDGSLVCSGGVDNQLVVRRTGDLAIQAIIKISGGNHIGSIGFSADGSLVGAYISPEPGVIGIIVLDAWSGKIKKSFVSTEIPRWIVKQRLKQKRGLIAMQDRNSPGRLLVKEVDDERVVMAINAHGDQINDWVFSENCQIIITAGGYIDHPWPVNPAGGIRIWNLGAGELLGELNNHKGGVTCLAISRDCRFLVSGGTDGVLNVWGLSDIANSYK